MYTVKVSGPGTITFRNRTVRTPATFSKISKRELRLLKVMCTSKNLNCEVLEAESERLAKVVEKVKIEEEVEVDETGLSDPNVEVLFESEDTLGYLLNNSERESDENN